MKYVTNFYIFLFILLIFYSCNTSSTDFAVNWTNEIKQKIIVDANQQPDKSVFDSAHYYLTLYKANVRLKQFILRPKFDTSGKIVFVDTLASTLYSTDQNFSLIRELCPAIERSFEGINYKNVGLLGLTEFKYCDGKIKESGFHYGFQEVGVWAKYDSTG